MNNKYLVVTKYYNNLSNILLDKLLGKGNYKYRKKKKVIIEELESYLEKDKNNYIVFLHDVEIIMHQLLNTKKKRIFRVKNKKLEKC